MLGWTGTTDSDGWVGWRSAPPGQNLNLAVDSAGYTPRHIALPADGTEQTVVLDRPPPGPPPMTGTVVDAVTGEFIPRFKAVPGSDTGVGNHYQFDRSLIFYGTNGVYSLKGARDLVRIEADGYRTEIGRAKWSADDGPRCDFKLKRETSGSVIHGVVLNSDGTPGIGVDVALCTLEEGATLARGKFLRKQSGMIYTQFVTNTDARGHFAFPGVRVPHTAVAVSESGFGRTRVRAGEPAEIHLEPFGVIEGEVRRSGVAVPGEMVTLQDQSFNYYAGEILLSAATYQTQTDQQGRFRFDKVPAVGLPLFLESLESEAGGLRFGHLTSVSIRGGETNSVILGDPDPRGVTVRGSAKILGAGPSSDWQRNLRGTLRRTVAIPKTPEGLSEDDRRLWLVDWHTSAIGQAAARDSASYRVKFDDNGNFTVRGVLPGNYNLYLSVREPDWWSRETREVTIPATGDAGGNVGLGLFEMKMNHRPAK